MGNWRKLLSRMALDTDPRNYTYDDAVRVLRGLGFEPANTKPKGSHRVWRRPMADRNLSGTAIVELVDAGHGCCKPVYIRKLVKELQRWSLLPTAPHEYEDLDDS